VDRANEVEKSNRSIRAESVIKTTIHEENCLCSPYNINSTRLEECPYVIYMEDPIRIIADYFLQIATVNRKIVIKIDHPALMILPKSLVFDRKTNFYNEIQKWKKSNPEKKIDLLEYHTESRIREKYEKELSQLIHYLIGKIIKKPIKEKDCHVFIVLHPWILNVSIY